MIPRFSGSAKCYPCQGLGTFRQGKRLLENWPRLRERCWIFSSETATQPSWVLLIDIIPRGPKDQKNSRFRSGLKISCENEIFERATHCGPIFGGEIETSRLKFSSEIKNFDRDWKFRSRSNFFDRWALWATFCVDSRCVPYWALRVPCPWATCERSQGWVEDFDLAGLESGCWAHLGACLSSTAMSSNKLRTVSTEKDRAQFAGVLRGNTIRGNTTRSSERRMALWEGLWEGLWKTSENL